MLFLGAMVDTMSKRQECSIVRNGIPSKTSLITAAYRAIHQKVDKGSVFKDPLAQKIAGIPGIVLAVMGRTICRDERLRFLFSARSAFSELYIEDSINRRGTKQIVLLGAGLDTLPYRSSYQDVTFFEIDHPSTQKWKLQKLKSSKIPIPENVLHASCDFENGDLFDVLQTLGFDKEKRSYFLFLGTIPYLTDKTTISILDSISRLNGGVELVFDYGELRDFDKIESESRAIFKIDKVEEEPYASRLYKEYLRREMDEMGYEVLFDLDAVELLNLFLEKEKVNMLMDQKYSYGVDARRICFVKRDVFLPQAC
jgi:methyltransferase (TIGR00027 family)